MNSRLTLFVLFAASLCKAGLSTTTEIHWVADFSQENLAQWEIKAFQGQTRYEIVLQDKHLVLKAMTHNSASGLGKKIRVDLDKTPYLHWSWRVDQTYPGLNEQLKAGDDYPARIYVIVEGGLAFWQTKALNYVWSSSQEAGSHWPNAFTSKAQMFAVRGKNAPLGQWLTETREVKTDFKQLFGENIRYIDGVAIMSDSDNAHGQAMSYYGNIYFSDQPH